MLVLCYIMPTQGDGLWSGIWVKIWRGLSIFTVVLPISPCITRRRAPMHRLGLDTHLLTYRSISAPNGTEDLSLLRIEFGITDRGLKLHIIGELCEKARRVPPFEEKTCRDRPREGTQIIV